MGISTAFITRTREDLTALSCDLAHNLAPSTLAEQQRPLLWSIYGSHASGKSLIAETIVSALASETVEGYFEDEPLIMGFQGTIHSYFDDRAHRQYQFWDILCARPKNKRTKQKKRQRELIPRILDIQERDGIIFLHNAPTTARKYKPDIEISITQERKLSDFFNLYARITPCLNKKLLRNLNLHNDFSKAKQTAGESSMIRLVQMTIHNPEIFAPDFTEHLKSDGYQAPSRLL